MHSDCACWLQSAQAEVDALVQAHQAAVMKEEKAADVALSKVNSISVGGPHLRSCPLRSNIS